MDILASHYHATYIQRAPDCYFPDWDCVLTLPLGATWSFEIKTDWAAVAKYENVAFETHNTYRDEPSGLSITKAQWWAHHIPSLRTILIFDVEALRWFLHVHHGRYGIKTTRPHGGDSNFQGITVPVDVIMAQSWPQKIATPAYPNPKYPLPPSPT